MSDNEQGREDQSAAAGTPVLRVPFVVAIGASAGGLQPIEEFFQHIPRGSGMAFVVVQHLSPDFKSLMPELLERQTRMPIHVATEGMHLLPDNIYLIPPKKNMRLRDGRLHLEDRASEPGQGPNFPIDVFFMSMADDIRERAIAVVLSGTGSDSSRGVRAVNDADGIVFVQDPDTAQFDGMPMAALGTGMAAHVLAPAAIARAIFDLAANPSARMTAVPDIGEADLREVETIIDALSRNQDVDFSNYKVTTMARRIERRRLIVGLESLGAYRDLIHESADERAALRNDLLITVTSFFRDAAAWRVLESDVLPKLILDSSRTEPLRLWVTACATGEEAYSMAMVVRELLERLGRGGQDVKIFATDIDAAALERASAGIYAESILADMTPERLQRFFFRRDDDYQVSRELREMIIFAPHNLIRDAPFTRMHLVSCRNALIYMQPTLQQHVLRKLHFALARAGVLFLGTADSVGELEAEFEPLDRKWNIHSKRREIRLPVDAQFPTAPATATAARIRRGYEPADRRRAEALVDDAFRLLVRDRNLLCLLIDPQHRLLHVVGDARGVLEMPEGAATRDVTRLVPRSLGLPLSTAIHRAQKEHEPVLYTGIMLSHAEEQGGSVNLRVTYREATRSTDPYLLVMIEPAEVAAPKEGPESYDLPTQAAQRIADLEHELQQTRENLQATIEELETTNEEQQATNEEMVASNEELQSTNEELHSVNEELYTVNAEYQAKIHELTELNNDVDNLLVSTEIGVIFLDEDLRIRKFTPAARRAVHLLPSDTGRPFPDLSFRVEYPELVADIRRVLSLGDPIAREAPMGEDGYQLVGINPYRAGSDLVTGVVLTFVDISELKRVEDALKRVEVRYRRLFDSSLMGVVVVDRENRVVEANDAWLDMMRFNRADLPTLLRDRVAPAREPEAGGRPPLQGSAANPQVSWAIRADGSEFPVLFGRAMLDQADGSFVAFVLDTSELHDTQAELVRRLEDLERTNQELQQFAYATSHDLQEPARMISSYLGLIEARMGSSLGAEEREFLDFARDGSDRLRALLQALLEYSRVQSRARPPAPVTTTEIVDDVLAMMAQEIEAAGAVIDREALPSVLADRHQLSQVFQHLLANALEYRVDTPEVRISGEVAEGEVVLTVADNGIGIHARDHQRVFAIFQRLHTTDEHPGNGLGLAVCKRIVERHGGRIWVESDVGAGARFRFTLPLPATTGKEARTAAAD